MNQPRNGLSDSVAIDPQHPWLGLASYSEETRAYFHGRDEEAAELARRVRRKLLTVLFGQSGLGKTSLLRAGLVPRLRDEGYCPVYVRVDYSPESPSPSEQIKQAIFKASAAAGHWTRAGSAVEGESLWEFLHHRGDLLRDADGRTLLPLLIFDQFEEIFTLAQADDAGRMRARRFLEELADLVENRPPAALERRLEQDEAHAEQFDFARADYRILVALREDYLAHLESVKGNMPSITQNRMRLARMSGAQALAAVLQPGGRLVSEEVAESIVRFVAGGSELANAEVEPSLLSLVCRELNTVRIAQGRDEISADLLAGSRATILTEFYERALADQPAGVRRVIEDELLTDSGYRESLAEERVRKALAAAGAAPDALATLVDRRLLRIEERLDMRRVELTHDVLCSVVASSRDLRHAREAREAAERQLAAQQAREAETHRTLLRTRMVAAVAAVLMLVAGASAVFGWVNYRRARVADAQAQQARADAEKLVGFLIEDFYAELEPTGRLETMGKLAHMAVSYYDGLPPGLLTPQTRIYRGMALVREGGALLARGDVEGSNRSLGEARALFEKLRTEGEQGEAVTLGLALAIFTKFSAATVGAPGGEDSELRHAAELLRPLAHAPGSSRQTRLVYADVLNYLSHTFENKEEAIATCEESRKLLVGLGALDLSDLSAASVYADTSDSQARHVMVLGRLDEAEKLERDVYAIADQVLVQRPGDFRSLRNRALAANLLGRLAERRHDPAAAADYATKAEEAGESYVRSNPSDLSAWDYWIRGKEQLAESLLDRGQVSESIRKLREAVALGKDSRRPSSLASQINWTWFSLASLEARAGQRAAALTSLEEGGRASLERQAQIPKESPRRALPPLAQPSWAARLHLYFGEFQQSRDLATATAARVRAINMSSEDVGARTVRDMYLRHILTTAAAAALRLGRYEESAAGSREQLALPPNVYSEVDPQEQISRTRVTLAHALAQKGSAAEARTILEPELVRYHGQRQRGAGGLAFRRDFAYALYVEAIAQAGDAGGRARRQAALAEAGQVLDGMPAEARLLSDLQELGSLIAAARGASG